MYAEDAEKRLHNLSERELNVSKSSLDIPDDEKRLIKCQEYVERMHASK
jgi:hypothetical protein